MRHFVVFLNRKIANVPPTKEVLEFEDDEAEETIEQTCREALECLMEQDIESGWDEISAEEAEKIRRRVGR